MPSLLVIDDDPSMPLVISETVNDLDISLHHAATARQGLLLAEQTRPAVAVLAASLPDQAGLETFARLRGLDAKLPIIFIAAASASSMAIEAMKLGAFDVLARPLDPAELRVLVARALEVRRLAQSPVEVRDAGEGATAAGDLLVGNCPAMQEIYKAIGRLAGQDVTVLVAGETGTGKELVARSIHQHSRRSAEEFRIVHCAGISDTDLDDVMVSAKRRPQNAGDRARSARQEPRYGGTLFLDEIGALPLALQSKIVRLLSERAGDATTPVESSDAGARLIVATSCDLEELVAAGRFRADLYYQLSGFKIELPPLRERLDDLPVLVRHSLKQLNPQFGKRVYRVAPEAIERLRRHSWPGNIRELQSVVKQALVRAAGPVLLADFLPESLSSAADAISAAQSSASGSATDWEAFVAPRLEGGSTEIYAESLAEMERHVLTRVLRFTDGNQARASRLLGMTRGSLRLKIRSLGIVIDRQIGLPGDLADARQPSENGALAE